MILNWVLFPLLFGGVLTGLGLGLRRLAGPFSAAYVLPAGYAVAVVVASLLTWSSATPALAGPALLVLAIGGWIAGWPTLRLSGALRHHWRWVLGGLMSFVAFGASVLATGTPTFTGYTEIVDIGHQFDLTAWVLEHGRTVGPQGVSAAQNVASRIIDIGYPTGSQAVLGAFARPTGLQIDEIYQPMLAVLAGAMVPVLYRLLRTVTASRNFALLGALVASQASVLVTYAQMGGIKELSGSLMLLLSCAFLVNLASGKDDGRFAAASEAPEADTSQDPAPPAASPAPESHWRAVLPFGLSVAAALSIFSITMLPWLGVLGVVGVGLVWRALSARTALIRGSLAVLVIGVTSLPILVAISNTSKYSSSVTSQTDLGNLSAPVSPFTATGIWLAGDHRFPIPDNYHDASVAIGIVVLLLAFGGLIVAWRRRALPLLALAASAMVAFVVVTKAVGPWVDLKVFCITAPVTLLFAAIGLSGLLTRRALRPIGWAAVLGLAAISLSTFAQRYHYAQLAPYDRMSELRHFGEKYKGAKGTLLTDWEEMAEFHMRKAGGASIVNASVWKRTPAAEAAKPGLQFDWDLDELDPAFVQSHELIVMRRSPSQSRPPRNYEQVELTKYHTVWKRTGAAPPTFHLALTSQPSKTDVKACRTALRAQSASPTLTVAPGADVVSTTIDPTKVSPNLVLQADGQTFLVNGQGRAAGQLDVKNKPGEYDVYIGGTSHRKVTLWIDEKKIATQDAQFLYAYRSTYVGTIKLAAGTHPVRLFRAGWSWAPGAHEPPALAHLGPIQVVPKGQLNPLPVTTPAADATCPKTADWVEAGE